MLNIGLGRIEVTSSVEAFDVVVDGKAVTVNKKEYMASDADIKKAEKELGMTFGPQTKELFKKYSGLYYGTVEFDDLEKAVGITDSMWDGDNRLKGKQIDKVFVASYGNGDHLAVDSNDKVYRYCHDGDPVFDNSDKLMKGNTLKQFIKTDYNAYQEYKNTKNKAAKENLESIINYLESHQENKEIIIDFLKQDPSFEALLSQCSSDKLIIRLQDICK